MLKQGHRRIGSLEVGRGVAAALVVLHHAGSIAEQPRFYGAIPFAGHLHYFYVGVDFFFVLSGFIIAWVHWDDLGRSGQLGSYATKRFLRIYPPYWGILVPLVFLYLLFPQGGLPSQRDPTNILMSFLLLPYPEPPVLGVAWTLVHEIFFYALFAVILVIGQRGLWLLPFWAAAIMVAYFVGPLPHLVAFVLSPFNIEFIMGAMAAVLLRRYSIPLPGLMATLGIFLFLLFMLVPSLVPQDPLALRFAFGIPSALFVLGMVEMEWSKPLRLPAWLAFFGAASYAVYLIHPVALSFAARVAPRIVSDVEAGVLILTVVGLVAGGLYHKLVEKRITQLTRSILQAVLGARRGARSGVH